MKFLKCVVILFFVCSVQINFAQAQCEELTGNPVFLEGNLVSSFLTGDKGTLVVEANNEKFNITANIEQLLYTRDMIGDKIKINYKERQYWDESKKICVLENEFIDAVTLVQSLEDITNKVLGNGSLAGKVLEVSLADETCYLVVDENVKDAENTYIAISCGETNTYKPFVGKDVNIDFTMKQIYFEPAEEMIKEIEIEKITPKESGNKLSTFNNWVKLAQPQDPAQQKAHAVNLTSLVGSYKFIDASSDGTLDIVQQGNDFVISVGTYHAESGHTCSFDGNCAVENGKIICKATDGEEGMNAEIKIVDSDTLELSAEYETERFFCGMNGFFSGKYKK